MDSKLPPLEHRMLDLITRLEKATELLRYGYNALLEADEMFAELVRREVLNTWTPKPPYVEWQSKAKAFLEEA